MRSVKEVSENGDAECEVKRGEESENEKRSKREEEEKRKEEERKK